MSSPYLVNPFNHRGRIDRGPYFAWGCLLLGIKFNVDRLAVWLVFGEPWGIGNYFGGGPHFDATTPERLSLKHSLLVAIALPFLYVGIALSIRRLRAAGLPLWLAALFVVPYLKWLLFAALSLLPSPAVSAEKTAGSGAWSRALDRLVPTEPLGSAVVAVVAAALLGIAGVTLGGDFSATYGWALFAGIPFLIGFVAVQVFSRRERRTLVECVAVAGLACGLAGLGLLLLAVEGLICLAMAVPIVTPLALMGAACGYALQRSPHGDTLHGGAILALPLLLTVDGLSGASAPLLQVTTALDIAAPRETVWQHVVTFSELPSEREWLFRTGIAFPVRATIEGHGVGAVRYCEFSTGPFVEPITVWDEPNLLAFAVTRNPKPMTEWTLYDEIHPPHLEGFLVSERGQFRLIDLGGDRTRLEGTTWYRHHMSPARYWQLWSDFIIHRIHGRVLRHIKTLAEAEAWNISKEAGTNRPVPRSFSEAG